MSSLASSIEAVLDSGRTKRTRTQQLLAQAALLGVALVLFWFRLGRDPLWLDETFSAAAIRYGFADIVGFAIEDVHPPLYYLLLKIFAVVFGSSDAALRVPSVLGALALVGLAFGPVRRIFGARAGWTYAVLVVASPGLVGFAHEARMYTWLAFLVAATTLYGYLAVVGGARSDFVKYAITSLSAAYVHYYGLVGAFMTGLGLLVLATTQHRQRLRPLLLAAGAVLLAYLPWLPSAFEQMARVSNEFWVPAPNGRLVALALVAPFTYKFPIPPSWQAVAALCLAALAITYAGWALTRARQREPSLALWLVIGVYAGTFLFGLIFSLCIKPVLMPRYMLAVSGLLLLASAAGLALLPPLPSLLGTLTMVALNLPAAGRVLTENFNGPFRELRGALAHDEARLVVHTDMHTLFPSARLLPEARHVLLFPPGAKVWNPAFGPFRNDRLSCTNDLGSLLATGDPLWLVEMTEAPPMPLDRRSMLDHLGWHPDGPERVFELPWSWVGIKLSKFVPDEVRGGSIQ